MRHYTPFLLCVFLLSSLSLKSFRENPFQESDILGFGYWTNGERCVPITYSAHEDSKVQKEKALQLEKAEGLGG